MSFNKKAPLRKRILEEDTPIYWHMAMGHSLCLHFGADEQHPCTTYFDVHQGYRVLSHSHIGGVKVPALNNASAMYSDLGAAARPVDRFWGCCDTSVLTHVSHRIGVDCWGFSTGRRRVIIYSLDAGKVNPSKRPRVPFSGHQKLGGVLAARNCSGSHVCRYSTALDSYSSATGKAKDPDGSTSPMNRRRGPHRKWSEPGSQPEKILSKFRGLEHIALIHTFAALLHLLALAGLLT